MTGRISLLIVDGDKDVCGAIGAYLSAHGFSVETCVSGDDALRFTEYHRFDAIIVDCHLPTKDGTALTRTIRERCPYVLLIALCSQYFGEETVGTKDCILMQKPVIPVQLLSMLKAAGNPRMPASDRDLG